MSPTAPIPIDPRPPHDALGRVIGLLLSGFLVLVPARAASAPLPDFAELEAAGARIGEIRITPRDIFDTSNPKEDRWLFRWANRLHGVTRPEVIERALLFKPGEPVSRRLIDETERLLRGKSFLYDVQIRPVAVRDGVVDIEVLTRDTWSFEPSVGVGRSGGRNTSTVRLRDYNLLGLGLSVGLNRVKNVDRTTTRFELSGEQLFGSWTNVALTVADNSDGHRRAVSVVRPFHELDARWAAGVSLSDDDRVDSVYRAGQVVSQFRRREQRAEVFAGWSPGLVDGKVHRFSAGVSLAEDRYAPEPGLVAPALLPGDGKLVVPFVRFERLEDRFERELNRNLIGSPEFFALGLAARLQLGYAAPATGSTRRALLYSASVSHGLVPAPGQTLITALQLSGEYSAGQSRRQQLGVLAQYYRPQSPKWLLYASAAADLLTRPDPTVSLLLGGDNDLRGYPLRYQSGTRRALLTLEERFHTDLYLWQLFRVGGAAFVDVGRAWGGNGGNAANPGWLTNVGGGLRFVSTRSAFSNVIHLDLAFPIDAPADIKRVQLLARTKATF